MIRSFLDFPMAYLVASALSLGGAGCGESEWGEPAPFEAPAAPEAWTRPAAPPTGAMAETAKETKTETETAAQAPKLQAHIYGAAQSWPCTGIDACAAGSPADGTLGIDIASAEFIDPSLVSETEGLLIAQSIFEGLVNPPMRSGQPIQPGVASRWELSEDGLVYTFHLRPDAKWTNGRRVVAQDFVYSWRRKLDPKTASTAVESLFWMEGAKAFNQGKTKDPASVGVRAIDDATLEVRLEHPTPWWLEYLASGQYLPVPREAFEAHGSAWTRADNIVSNGPYRLTEWLQRSRLVMKKSANYWDAASVRIPQIVAYVSESQTVSKTRYDSGQIQWGRAATRNADIPGYMKANRPDFFIDPYLCYYAYIFRTDTPPFDDIRVRRAINMAIDKETLVSQLTQAQQVAADGPVPFQFTETMGYPKPKGDGFNVRKARQLLTEAGFPAGRGFPKVTISINSYEFHKLAAAFVQEQLKSHLGLEVEVLNMEWKSLLKTLRAGDFQMARYGWCGIEHPYSMMSLMQSHHAENAAAFKSEAFDALMDKGKMTQDHAEQMRIFAKAEAILQREVPMSSMYYYTRAYLRHPALGGHEPNLNDVHLFKYMYWKDKASRP